jgi:putative endonuclease
MNMFYVYMVKCNDGTFYVGSTTDIERRLHQHNTSKAGAHYTKIRRPVTMVYSESCPTYAAARAREGALKRLTRQEKMALVEK